MGVKPIVSRNHTSKWLRLDFRQMLQHDSARNTCYAGRVTRAIFWGAMRHPSQVRRVPQLAQVQQPQQWVSA